MLRKIALLTVLASVALTARSADDHARWYVTPQIGYVWTDPSGDYEDDTYHGLSIGRYFTPTFALELGGAWSSHSGTSSEVDVRTMSMNALRVFKPNRAISPYLTVGAGYIWKDWDRDRKDYGPLAHAGIGLLIDLTQNSNGAFTLQLRPEAHLRWDVFGESLQRGHLDYTAGLGLTFGFGGTRVARTNHGNEQ
jgi:opacity protein-like surface antigen